MLNEVSKQASKYLQVSVIRFSVDLLAIKGHRPLTYHIIIHIAIGKKETMTMQSCKLYKQISHQYLVNRLTCTLLIVFLNNNKLLKLTIEGRKLFQIPATRSVEKWRFSRCDVSLHNIPHYLECIFWVRQSWKAERHPDTWPERCHWRV